MKCVTMKRILAVNVICCILNLHLIQGNFIAGVIRDTCLDNELPTALINSVSNRTIYNVCIPSPPFTEECTSVEITVRGWRCPGNSLPVSPSAGRMRCCTKEGLEIKKCIVDPNIITFDKDFVLVPPKGFHLKGRIGVG
ncbi:uncharacterized protein LOC134241762 [Saccostrea cucullata]|uniref:uncharacterized protein LOC134241762 n=1 Tax=Saccostrea cuccullata TaxID=36930 RepID=UPI002ED54670